MKVLLREWSIFDYYVRNNSHIGTPNLWQFPSTDYTPHSPIGTPNLWQFPSTDYTSYSPIGTPNLWQFPRAISAPRSPGGFSRVRAMRSVAMATRA